MTRVDVLNALIGKYKYVTYLEIGVQAGTSFKEVKIPLKTGVDPDPKCRSLDAVNRSIYIQTSDAFFELIQHSAIQPRWDLIFIDGMHTYEQALRDINNALRHLNPNGSIVVHDLNPPDADAANPVPNIGKSGGWCGDVWRAWMALRMTRDDLTMYTVDCDWGVGVIRRGTQQLYQPGYAYLEQYRQFILELKSPEEFLREVQP